MPDGTAFDVRALLDAGAVPYGPGLTAAELAAVEDAYGFRFAPDHRELLTGALPLGAGWPDWRDGGAAKLKAQLSLPAAGVLFDVEHAAFWPTAWGPRPAQLRHALKSARWHLAKAPTLVPLHANHYLPAAPAGPGHPVLAIRRTEVTVIHGSLSDYLRTDLTNTEAPTTPPPSTVPFWSDLIAGSA
ncbi:hypothetical protein [Yinghuangia seranimata]|uniref:hypothetical protein n=1 Tax=Yinghuangia seranimata TaxID=408067 RepID=UPI00248B70FF|nr:hypothetical protein [Yinghuangia seranimata]MDI2126153.1 hypothetical protein [Yinghuangia seranimata]